MLLVKLVNNFHRFIDKATIYVFQTFTNLNSITLNFFHINNFFKEGMYIDFLQKSSIDKLLKSLFIQSAQFLNLNFINYKLIRFIIDNVFKILNIYFYYEDNLNFFNAIWGVLFLFIFTYQFIILYYINLIIFC